MGQGAFSATTDVAVLDALETRLLIQEADRGALHAATLRTVLQMHAVYSASGLGISTVSHAALAMHCSEHRVAKLLTEASALAELPGALEAVECGLLTVEQSAVVVGVLAPLTLEARLFVWRRLIERLTAEVDAGAVLPPARLTELLRRWAMEVDQRAAAERRREAEADRRIDYRRNSNGLGDLFAYGFRGPDLQAILSRIAARSMPFGADDDRTADQRRFDAFKDLLLGRDQLPMPGGEGSGQEAAQCRPGCACRAGAPVPCGAELLVHVPHGGALGRTDEAAELVGHGPIESDLLEQLLLAAPRLRPVWVDERGVPVAVGAQVLTPARGDPGAARDALLRLAATPPLPASPRHPQDHAPEVDGAGREPGPGGAAPVTGAGREPGPATGGSHPGGEPGPYRPPRWLRRLINVRAPRCEFPGCGARAVRCDAEHDHAWPDGPTCACNLGPCCRRHHRVKQQGWIKTRGQDSSVRWAAPTGRSWLSRGQHSPPAAPARPLPPLPSSDPLDELSPLALEHELWSLGLLPDDDGTSSPPPVDREPDDTDRLGDRITDGDTRWTLDLADPYRWFDDLRSQSP